MGLWPEETLFAFEQSKAMGVDVLEMDIHSTLDNAIVVFHDDIVDRTTNGSGPVRNFTLLELQILDAGYNWSPDQGKTFPYRGKGMRVPELEEVFLAYPDMHMNIEIKQVEPSLTEPLCKLIRSSRMEDRVLVVAQDDNTIKDFREACPEIATGAAQNEGIKFFLMNKLMIGFGYNPTKNALQVPEYTNGLHVVTDSFIRTAHERNLRVDVWTVNEVADMQRLIGLDVDGIMTDYPDRLLKLLDR
jgi:glycerophosphoryl diester phosphodiesterase